MKFALFKILIACFIAMCCSLLYCTPLANSSVSTTMSDNTKTTTTTENDLIDNTEIDTDADSISDIYTDDSNYIIPIYTFYQIEEPWASYLYGDYDPLETHGCGPTTLATAVSALTDELVTPIDVADWSADNGYYSQGSGSFHDLIPDGAEHYGLTCESCTDISGESFQAYLDDGSLLILLMGPGDFSTSGHFILVHGYSEDGEFFVSDPASYDNTAKTWSADSLISQLSAYAKSGGPVWVISN